jgi:hypothetical protein
MAVIGSAPITAAAQRCDTLTSRVGLSALAGLPIRSVDIVTLPPTLALPALQHAAEHVHRVTQPGTIRRELLFMAGDSVDTLRIAESLRRLRALVYLDEAEIQGRTCTDSAGVAVTVVTRDSWSAQPIFTMRQRSLALGVAESNAFGTGRVVRLTMQSDAMGFGAGTAVRDPALWNGRLDGQIGGNLYASGSSWAFVVKQRRRTLADPWMLDLRALSSHRVVDEGLGNTFDDTRLSMLGGHRLTSGTGQAALYAVTGIEADRANVQWTSIAPLIGSPVMHRQFVGADIGFARRPIAYDTLGWVLRHDGILDVPTATEGELVTGLGWDAADHRAKAHVDSWLGRVWTLHNRTVVAGTMWANGFVARSLLQAATIRGSISALSPTSNGMWVVRAAAERLYDPDPTVRALSTTDPTAFLLIHDAWLARGAASASLERDFRLLDIGRVNELDAALFGAYERRWDTASSLNTDISAPILGIGLRFAPSRTPGVTLRLDGGYRFGVQARPVFAFSITPWFTAGRNTRRSSMSAVDG